MAIKSSKRMEYAQRDLETLKGLKPDEAKSVLQTMSVERKRAMGELIQTVRHDLVPKTNLDLAIEEAFSNMEVGKLEHAPASKEQMTLFSDQDIERALAQFGRKDVAILSKELAKVDLAKDEIEKVYQIYSENAKKIFETGEWGELKSILLQRGLSEKEANIKTDAIIVHAYRLENPGADLPPFAQVV
jgi:hypothetical protein